MSTLFFIFLFFFLVPQEGLEPPRLSAKDFESSASTNFTTEALVPAPGLEPGLRMEQDFKSCAATYFTMRAFIGAGRENRTPVS